MTQNRRQRNIYTGCALKVKRNYSIGAHGVLQAASNAGLVVGRPQLAKANSALKAAAVDIMLAICAIHIQDTISVGRAKSAEHFSIVRRYISAQKERCEVKTHWPCTQSVN